MRFASKTRWLVTPVAILALAVAGCGDDDDDDGNNGAGPTGAGEPITAANASIVQGQIFGVVGAVAGKGPGTHQGAHSGRVKIDVGTGKLAQAGLNLNMDFNNFSEDGVNWLDGTIAYTVSGTNISYTVDLTISGAYSGKVRATSPSTAAWSRVRGTSTARPSASKQGHTTPPELPSPRATSRLRRSPVGLGFPRREAPWRRSAAQRGIPMTGE